MKVFWLFNHPAPYKVDFFNELGKSCDLTVVFERANEAGRNSIFYSEKPLCFHAIIAKSLYLGGVNNWTREPVKILKKNHYDLIVINGWRTLSERNTISFLKRHHIPYIFYINGGLIKPHENGIKAEFKSSYIRGASAYFCPDRNSAKYLTHYGADSSKIFLYPYSSIFASEVLPSPYTPYQKASLREHLRVQGSRIFISSGQFIERKNFTELIALWKDVPKDWTLLLVGEGKEKKKYEKEQSDLGLSNVLLLPFRPHKELLRLFRACDAFIFLSKEDIYGHVINEALSQGLPVVSSAHVNAAAHLIKNGYNGFLIDLDDRKGIIDAIGKTNDPVMSLNAIEVAKQNTIEASAKFHLEQFEVLTKASKQ
jgi:glycosyltransferase involved in cell wall biosynthesis